MKEQVADWLLKSQIGFEQKKKEAPKAEQMRSSTRGRVGYFWVGVVEEKKKTPQKKKPKQKNDASCGANREK